MPALTDKTALVTGASRGIGAACARALDAAGARVGLAARSTDELEALAKELAHGPVVLPSDLSLPGAAEKLLGEATEALGRVDVLVNNAGVTWTGPSHKMTEEEVDHVFALNQRSVLLLAARAASQMAKQGGGSIVNMSSAESMVGVKWQTAYAATKGALDAMTRSLAAEWGPKNVRVNAVNPGIIDTDMWAPFLPMPGVTEHLLSMIPLRRLGTGEDVAEAVVFLASDAARYITAQTLTVDGGAVDTVRLMPTSIDPI